MSPTSLKLTHEQLRRGKQKDLKGCLRMVRTVLNCIERCCVAVLCSVLDSNVVSVLTVTPIVRRVLSFPP